MWPFVVVAVVLVVLIVGFFIADAAAKTYARDQIRARIVSALGVSSAADVTVDVGSGSILLQALTGSLDTVDVRVPQLAFGGLVGAADIHATRVPLDTSKPVGALEVSYAVSGKNLAALAKNLSGREVTGVALDNSEIVAATTFTVLGAAVPVSLGLTPSVSRGELVFTPSDVRVGGQTFTAAQLAANPLFGNLARTLLKQQSFCVAQYLPKVLTATTAQVASGSLILGFSGDGIALDGSGFTTKGSCS